MNYLPTLNDDDYKVLLAVLMIASEQSSEARNLLLNVTANTLREPPINNCPTCECNELLCGYPRGCCTEND